MSDNDELRQEIARLRERMSRMSAASLRISESLDLESVLREVVDSARVLTGAANAAISTVDRGARVQDFISSGLTSEERRQLWDLPEGERLWGYLLQSSRPLRVDDLASHLDALGIATAPILRRSFLGRPFVIGARTSATSISPTRRAGGDSLTKTKRSWCCSHRRPRRPSPTPRHIATSAGPAPIWRPWSTPRRGRGGVRGEDRRARAVQSRGAADGGGPGLVGPPY